MFGPSVDRLNVYLRDDKNKDQLIFTKYGTQGNQWLRGQKEIKSDTLWSVRKYSILTTAPRKDASPFFGGGEGDCHYMAG